MQRIGLRLAYDGTRFFGFQRQPQKRTAEGELIRVLKEIGAIHDTGSSSYRLSSRTDRGVSALGNVVSIDTEFPREQIPKAINSLARDLWCTGSCVLPKDFDVRTAKSRTYAYYIHDEGHDLAAMQKASKLFVGRHDFSGYARLDGRNPVRTITAFKVMRRETAIEFLISGESFLWNQVRRMVWAVDRVGRGQTKASDISPEHLAISRVGVAPAENLVLVKVDIGHKFEAPDNSSRTLSDIKSRFIVQQVKARLMEGILLQLSR